MAKISKDEIVSIEVLVKICGVLNCTLDDIVEFYSNEENKMEN